MHVSFYSYTINIIFRKRERSRQGRATAQQIEALISYLEKHPEVASEKFTTMNAHDSLEKRWQDLATHLNSLVPQGKEKDVKSWKTVTIYKY